MYDYVKMPAKNLTECNFMTGVSDFGNLAQFDMYEGGYGVLVCVKIPVFLDRLKDKEGPIGDLIKIYTHIIERDFKSLDGIDDITSDTLDITDGITTFNVIGKVTMQGSTNFTMRFQERSGSPITKVHELYLRGLRDPRAGQVKHYHGLIESGEVDASFQNETFTFLYINTDSTMRNVEKAYLLIGCQPTTAKTSIYTYEKGGVDFKDVDVEFNGFPLTSEDIDMVAKAYIRKVIRYANNKPDGKSIAVNSAGFHYTGATKDDLKIPLDLKDQDFTNIIDKYKTV